MDIFYSFIDYIHGILIIFLRYDEKLYKCRISSSYITHISNNAIIDLESLKQMLVRGKQGWIIKELRKTNRGINVVYIYKFLDEPIIIFDLPFRKVRVNSKCIQRSVFVLGVLLFVGGIFYGITK